jgi:hypothetical protein
MQAVKRIETGGMRTLLPTIVISPHDIRPLAETFRDMPVTADGAADLEAILRALPEDEPQSEALHGLLRDVATGRVIHPVVVRPDPEDTSRYALVSGWLVWSAALHLHKDSVHALVWHGNDLEAATLAYKLNHHRVQMKRRESARMAAQVAMLLALESETAGYKEVARALGCSPSWAYKLLHESEPLEAEEPAPANGRRGRGRPRIARLFSFEIFDPRRWESSVRLRAVVQGGTAFKELRFQRSEEADGWHDVPKEEFVQSLITEIDRLQQWLAAYGNAQRHDFSPGKIGAPFAPRVEPATAARQPGAGARR